MKRISMSASRRVFGPCFVVAVVASLALGSVAIANDMRVHSSACHSSVDNRGANEVNGEYAGVTSAAPAGYADIFYCPVVSTTSFSHGSVYTINVHGLQGDSTNSTDACIKDYNDQYYSCGTRKFWGAGYTGAVLVDGSVWRSNPAQFAYLANNIYRNGRIFGFYLNY
jgi:hypothetical protein